MPSLRLLSPSEFESVNENLNVEPIAQILFELGVLSLQDHVKVINLSQKSAVKFIVKRLKSHKSGNEKFQQALQKSKEHHGHQVILSVLYHIEISMSHAEGMIG